MQTLTLTRTGTPGSSRHPKAEIVSLSRNVPGSVVLPFAPKITDHSGSEMNFAVLERAYDKPLLRGSSSKPRVLEMNITVFNSEDNQRSVEHILAGIARFASEGALVYLRNMGARALGAFRITAHSEHEIMRKEGTNELTSATVDMTWTEDYRNVRFTSMPVRSIADALGKPAANPRGTPAPRSYIVKAGDLMTGVSFKVYGTTSRWREIADANALRDVRALQPGRELIIPA